MQPPVFAQLGATGDIIIILPALKAIHDRTDVKPILIVSREFCSVLDGVSYVTPDVTEGHWIIDTKRIDEHIQDKYNNAIWVPWWNAGKQGMMDAAAKHGGVSLRVHGVDWSVDQTKYPGFMQSFYIRMGFSVAEMMSLPLIFDRRSPSRESALRDTHLRGSKPFVLLHFDGKASPFAAVPEVMKVLEPLRDRFEFVDLGKIHAERIYDLLGLMDAAAGMILIDSAPLHLAYVTKTPFIAFTRDGWSGSVPRGKCQLNIKYSQTLDRLKEIPGVVEKWLAPAPAQRIIRVNGASTDKPMIRIRRSAALGDVTAATSIADRLAEQGFAIQFQSGGAAHPILRRHPAIQSVTEPNGAVDINLDNSYESRSVGERKNLTFSEIYAEVTNSSLGALGYRPITPRNCTPRIGVTAGDIIWAMEQLKYPKPWTMICPRSLNWNIRTIGDPIWQAAARQIIGTKFWLGIHGPAPAGIVDLQCRHVDNLIRYLAAADLLVTVDSGPMHIAAALRTPVVAIAQASSPENHLSDQNDFLTVQSDLGCLNCQLQACPINVHSPPCQLIDPERISAAANRKLWGALNNDVSACVATYRADKDVLNRCLTALLPQVQEVIVSVDAGGQIPAGALTHGKIKYVRHRKSGLGYGKNANRGIRESNGAFLLLVNDDVFIDPGAVERMKSLMTDPNVGVVSNLLRYPNGAIYHAGKVRSPGQRGWGHIDHGAQEPSFKNVTELENVCGACILVRRKAFYEVNGFREEYHLYSEDDDFAMSMRQAGYKLLFTPHSTGIHLNHHSTQHLPDMGGQLHASAQIFESRWGWWLDKNAHTIPGTF